MSVNQLIFTQIRLVLNATLEIITNVRLIHTNRYLVFFYKNG